MIKCPKCGTDNMLNAIFCRGCGEKLNLEDLKIENQLEDLEDKNKDMSKLANQIVGGVLAFVIVVVLAMLFIPVTGSVSITAPTDEAKALQKSLVKPKETKAITVSQEDLTSLLNVALNLPRKGDQSLLPQGISVSCQEEGTVKIIMKNSLFGFIPLNANVVLKPTVKEKGKIEFEHITGIRLGWLPFMPAALTDEFILPFKNTAQGNTTLAQILGNTKALTITEGSAEFQVEKKVSPKKGKKRGKKGKKSAAPAPAPVGLPF